MFSQAVQNPPTPAQPGVYNNMSITVSMAGGNTNVQNINPMMGQMQMSSLQMPGMNTVCPEQVSDTAGTCCPPPRPHHRSLLRGRPGMFSYSSKITTPSSDACPLFLNKLGGKDALLYDFPPSFDNYYLLDIRWKF